MTKIKEVLHRLGLNDKLNKAVFNGKIYSGRGPEFDVINPSNLEKIASVRFANAYDYEDCISNMEDTKRRWAKTPMPTRGLFLKKLAVNLTAKKYDLGYLLSSEIGKTLKESYGEVQEFIDICDMAVGMSRQIGGTILPSERSNHVIMETWSPLKNSVGIITAFNFPVAVFGWNSAISLLCGATQMVLGSQSASLTTLATQKILVDTLKECSIDTGIATLCQGQGPLIGGMMSNDDRFDVISFTGSNLIGSKVATKVARRFGRSILELGGNNAMIIMDDADMDMALQSVFFSAIGTTGQRCTSLRRLLLHENIYDSFIEKLNNAYSSIKIGPATDPDTLCGPLHSKKAVDLYHDTISVALKQGAKSKTNLDLLNSFQAGYYVRPVLLEIDHYAPIVHEERFVPIVYVSKFKTLEEAIYLNNSVGHGLTSSLFTKDFRRAMKWMSPDGSDCGLININTSSSGAEIGAAFGGNKDSGHGRESGSDAWKQYMRRGTSTINYGNSVELAQGLVF